AIAASSTSAALTSRLRTSSASPTASWRAYSGKGIAAARAPPAAPKTETAAAPAAAWRNRRRSASTADSGGSSDMRSSTVGRREDSLRGGQLVQRDLLLSPRHAYRV